jgi:S1-C subfamily serine protease
VFRRAYELVSRFTVPVVISQRDHDGSVACGVGAAVVVNDEGWIVTAAHLLEPALAFERGELQNVSYWFGRDGWAVSTWEAVPAADLAAARLSGFDRSHVDGYPVFQTGDLGPGRSLCRLGFPFHAVGATFDEARGIFALEPGALPIPRFPNEGIMTRFLQAPDAGVPYPVGFIETSSPGLRGQSGGPLFDPDGHVWGIQSRTNHVPLGFDPQIEVGGAVVTEHQFMNVGVATASETVLGLLGGLGVEVATSDD